MHIIYWRVSPAKRKNWQGYTLIATFLLVMLMIPWLASSVIPVLSVGIDAGHGGKDPGALGASGLKEKDVTLSIAKHVAYLLQEAGVSVHLTRNTDERLAQNQRSDLQARVRAADNSGVDLFISIHTNSFHDKRVRGPRTYYQPNSIAGQQLACCIQTALCASAGCGAIAPYAEDFLVTRETRMTAVIVEVGYISNPKDEQLLAQPAYQRQLAAVIVKGVLTCYPPQ